MTEREISVSALIFSVLALFLVLFHLYGAPSPSYTNDPIGARDVSGTEVDGRPASAASQTERSLPEPDAPIVARPIAVPGGNLPREDVPNIDPIKTGITPVRP